MAECIPQVYKGQVWQKTQVSQGKILSSFCYHNSSPNRGIIKVHLRQNDLNTAIVKDNELFTIQYITTADVIRSNHIKNQSSLYALTKLKFSNSISKPFVF